MHVVCQRTGLAQNLTDEGVLAAGSGEICTNSGLTRQMVHSFGAFSAAVPGYALSNADA
jgi:hypothetical protein